MPSTSRTVVPRERSDSPRKGRRCSVGSTLMPTFAMALDLVDDPRRIAEYDAHHRAVWPEVVSGLREIGITRMRIFRAGNRLFMMFDGPPGFDPAVDYQRYAENPRCRAWDELMREYQQQVPGATGAWWEPMELVFDLEAQ
jgi:L-rhamnose mutarotase